MDDLYLRKDSGSSSSFVSISILGYGDLEFAFSLVFGKLVFCVSTDTVKSNLVSVSCGDPLFPLFLKSSFLTDVAGPYSSFKVESCDLGGDFSSFCALLLLLLESSSSTDTNCCAITPDDSLSVPVPSPSELLPHFISSLTLVYYRLQIWPPLCSDGVFLRARLPFSFCLYMLWI